MKSFHLFHKEVCPEELLVYPCKDANIKPLVRRTASIFTSEPLVQAEWMKELGAEVFVNPSDDEVTKTKIAIVLPNEITQTDESAYYEVLDYYFLILQKLVHLMKDKHNFKHIIVLLPAHSNEFSTSYSRMAYYAIYGLIQGLGRLYAAKNLFVNGIIMNENNPQKNLKERIQYLSADNSCNTVGQVFIL